MNMRLKDQKPLACTKRKLYVNTAMYVSRCMSGDLRLMTLKDSVPVLINFDNYGACYAKGAQCGSTALVQCVAGGVILLGIDLMHAPPLVQRADVRATYMYAEYEVPAEKFGRPMKFALLGYPMFIPFADGGTHPLLVKTLPIESTTARYMSIDVEGYPGTRKLFFSRFPDMFELYAEMLLGVRSGDFENSNGELDVPAFEQALFTKSRNIALTIPESYRTNVDSEITRFVTCVCSNYGIYRRYELSASIFDDLCDGDLPIAIK